MMNWEYQESGSFVQPQPEECVGMGKGVVYQRQDEKRAPVCPPFPPHRSSSAPTETMAFHNLPPLALDLMLIEMVRGVGSEI
jgi:hypothetical protein